MLLVDPDGKASICEFKVVTDDDRLCKEGHNLRLIAGVSVVRLEAIVNYM